MIFNAINRFYLFDLFCLYSHKDLDILEGEKNFPGMQQQPGEICMIFVLFCFFCDFCDKKSKFFVFALVFFQSFWGEPLFIGGNSPSSSNRKHCFGGDSVAVAISWNFSELSEIFDELLLLSLLST
jgi:hypothetical protein